MLEQTVEVTALEADSVLVRPLPQGAACPACAGGSGCGAAPWVRLFGQVPVRIEAPARSLPAIGQHLRVRVPEPAILSAVWWLYGAPLAGLIGGAACGQAIVRAPVGSDALAAALGLSGLAVGALLARLATRRLARRATITPLGPTPGGPGGQQ